MRLRRNNNCPLQDIWFGKTDDLWHWGKPKGWGGPWRYKAVRPGEASDPFLMTGFDKKMVHLKADKRAEFDIEVDTLGSGAREKYERILTRADGYQYHVFPEGFSAHWVRIVSATSCTATAEFFCT